MPTPLGRPGLGPWPTRPTWVTWPCSTCAPTASAITASGLWRGPPGYVPSPPSTSGTITSATRGRILAASPFLAGLHTLHLSSCALGDEGARALAASPHPARLVTLDLAHNHITATGVKALA